MSVHIEIGTRCPDESSTAQYSVHRSLLQGRMGLLNVGQSCALNTLIQCLASIEPLFAVLVKNVYIRCALEPSSMAVAVTDTIQCLRSNPMLLKANPSARLFDNPSKLRTAVQESSDGRLLFNGLQHDIGEILTLVIDQLHNDLAIQNVTWTVHPSLEEDKLALSAAESFLRHHQNSFSVIIDVVYGMLHTRRKEAAAENFTDSFEPFQVLYVPVTGKTLEDCFRQWNCVDVVTDANPTMSIQTQQQQFLFRLPRLLIVQLLRFGSKGNKITSCVQLTERCDLRFLVCPTQKQAGSAVYDLMAVANHRGQTAQSGHYYSFCKQPMVNANDDDEWVLYDDANFETVCFEEHVSEGKDAYLLFLVRRF